MDRQTRHEHEDELRAAQQAVAWLSRLESGQPEDRSAFAQWLTGSPLHVQEFLTMTAIDQYLEHVPADYPLDLGRLRAAASNAVIPIFPELDHGKEPVVRKSRSARLPRRLACAASLVAAIIAAAWWMHAAAWQRYATGIGEQRGVELADGSIVYLNARSRIDVHLTQDARDIFLAQGEALFKVRHDAARPFRVHAQTATIQAVGTQFNVYRHAHETTVAVLEGAVRISMPRTEKATANASPADTGPLSAGDEARVAPAGKISIRHGVDVAKTLVWRERRLVFDQTPLPEIAAEFNRYNRKPQLSVTGASAQRRRFTGAFDADDPESLAQLLARDARLTIEHAGDRIVIRDR